MTNVPDVYPQFGPTLAFAERALTAVLRDHLGERDTTPETWYALRLIADRGPAVSREAVSEDLAGSRNLAANSARELLARLEGEGLIHGDAALELTAAGEDLYHSLREHVLSATVRLLSQFDLNDIETTVRTLQAITDRAGTSRSAA